MPEAFKFPDEEDDKTLVTDDSSEEIEVEIVDDTPEQDRGRKPLDKEVADPTDDEIESYSEKVRSRIKELTHARHDERRIKEATLREKQELERLAQTLIEENKQLKGYAENGAKYIASTNVSAAEMELQQARQAFKAAQEAFDTDAIMAAQEALAEAKWKLESAKNVRVPPLQTTADRLQTPQTSRPTRQAIAEPDEKTLRWQAKNQWFGSNGFEEVTSFALGLHQKLVNTGVDPRSDEYFEQIDARVKNKFPEVFGDSRETQSTRRPASVVAPATRSTGPKRIKLTSTAAALARKFGLTPEQYAAQVAKLESKNGY
jgi:hypothetical protein